jgi:hypothetical protein
VLRVAMVLSKTPSSMKIRHPISATRIILPAEFFILDYKILKAKELAH